MKNIFRKIITLLKPKHIPTLGEACEQQLPIITMKIPQILKPINLKDNNDLLAPLLLRELNSLKILKTKAVTDTFYLTIIDYDRDINCLSNFRHNIARIHIDKKLLKLTHFTTNGNYFSTYLFITTDKQQAKKYINTINKHVKKIIKHQQQKYNTIVEYANIKKYKQISTLLLNQIDRL